MTLKKQKPIFILKLIIMKEIKLDIFGNFIVILFITLPPNLHTFLFSIAPLGCYFKKIIKFFDKRAYIRYNNFATRSDSRGWVPKGPR